MTRYIDADECLDTMRDEMAGTGYQNRAMNVVKYAPTVDVVSVKAFELVKWERDTAIEQLWSHGIALCENKELVEVVRCKDCKYRRELDCPMYHEELEDCDDGDYVYTDIVATDNTVDDGFCHRGEKIESEADK